MQINKHIFVLFFLLANFFAEAQVIYPDKIYSLPSSIKESSGIIRYNKSNLITLNDGGNKNELYMLDTAGRLVKSIEVEGAVNVDWEDLSVSGKKIFIADIGNNLNSRKNLCIYSLNLNENKVSQLKKIKIAYADQKAFPPNEEVLNFDAEAILSWKDSVFIFSKDRSSPYSGYTKMYAFNSTEANDLKLLPLDSFHTGDKGFITNSITGAAISANGKIMALTSCLCLYVFYDYKSGDFFNGKFAVFRYSDFTQKEAVAFKNTNEIYVTDEKLLTIGGRLLTYDIGKYLNGKTTFYAPVVEQCSVKFNKVKSKILVNCKIQETAHLHIEIHQNDGKLIYTSKGKAAGKLELELENKQNLKNGFYRIYAGNQLLYAAVLK